MTALTQSLPLCATPNRRLRRFADDLGMSVVLSAWAAVLIILVDRRPNDLYEQLVYSICIGVVAVTIIDGVRLRFLDDPVRLRRLKLPFLAPVPPDVAPATKLPVSPPV
jgi:hypothetical protein